MEVKTKNILLCIFDTLNSYTTTLCIIELSNASHVFICTNLGVFNYSMNIHLTYN